MLTETERTAIARIETLLSENASLRTANADQSKKLQFARKRIEELERLIRESQ